MDILFINSCVRGKEESRTYKLAESFISDVKKNFPSAEITEVNLNELKPQPLYYETFKERESLIKAKDFKNPIFDLAKRFVAADRIIVAAPLWENSFPSVLKAYIEQVSVSDIAFKYTDNGSVGLCRAKKMAYITTRGGYMTGEYEHLEMGARYLKTICLLFGIEKFDCIAAEGIDIWGNDVNKILEDARTEAAKLAETFCL